jgi:hypothetical protein
VSSCDGSVAVGVRAPAEGTDCKSDRSAISASTETTASPDVRRAHAAASAIHAGSEQIVSSGSSQKTTGPSA